MMDDSVANFGAEYDAAKSTVSLTVGNDKSRKFALSWSRPDADHLTLEGTLANGALSVRLRKIDPATYRLLSRGYHWINEFPFNR
jgi:hypothetical protein